MYKEKLKQWWECDYCGKKMEEMNIYDPEFSDNGEATDICENPKCYKEHIKVVREKLKADIHFMFWVLDELSTNEIIEEYRYSNNKLFILWNKDDKKSTYAENSSTLINLIMPYYEKYLIIKDGRL